MDSADELQLRIRVYTAGQAAASTARINVAAAFAGLREVDDRMRSERGDVQAQVIDLLVDPAAAESARVLATPMYELTVESADGRVRGVRRLVGECDRPEVLRDAARAIGFG